jgi:hypothetical protein
MLGSNPLSKKEHILTIYEKEILREVVTEI